jgi:hypothetical protein
MNERDAHAENGAMARRFVLACRPTAPAFSCFT